KAKARTINTEATINTRQYCVPSTFRSDLLKRAKHSGHLYVSKPIAVPNLVPHCGHVTRGASSMRRKINWQPPINNDRQVEEKFKLKNRQRSPAKGGYAHATTCVVIRSNRPESRVGVAPARGFGAGGESPGPLARPTIDGPGRSLGQRSIFLQRAPLLRRMS